jgi:hypothetical protein
VGLLGVPARLQGIADDGVFIDTGQPRRLSDATAVVQVLEDGEGLVVRQAGAEQGGAGAFGEPVLTGATGEHPPLVLAVVKGNAQVAVPAQAVVGAFGVLAAEEGEVVHERLPEAVISKGQVCWGL